jgi:signal transduction histidine kinase
MNRIFEPYFSNKEKGIGLGLTSTQTIIYNHKGTIHVESQLSKGTSFVVTFDFKPDNV